MVEMTFMSAGIITVIVIVVVVGTWLLFQLKRKIPLKFSEDLGSSYVLKTKDAKKAYDTYIKLTEDRLQKGMVISRVFPERLSQKYPLDNTTFLWLSYEKTENSIDPSDLDKLEFLIHEFVSSRKGAVILLDGVEYLILQNSFENTLKFLQSLNDQIILNGAALVMPLDPASLDTKELSLLERELETYQVDYRLMRFFE